MLNRRGGVRLPTIYRVLSAAGRLGYQLPPDLLAGYQPPPMRLAFVLPEGANRYLQMMAQTVSQSAEEMKPHNVDCRPALVTSFNPKALADRLRSLASDYDGVAFMALEHPLVREAAAALHADGVHVLTLISDLSKSARTAFVGMDNRAAGRTAGLLLGRFIGAAHPSGTKVAMFAGSLSYRGHEEREMGFGDILAENFPTLEVIGLREGQDDPERNYQPGSERCSTSIPTSSASIMSAAPPKALPAHSPRFIVPVPSASPSSAMGSRPTLARIWSTAASMRSSMSRRKP